MDEEKVGYRNINKGMRRITALERDGITPPALLKKVFDTLKLDACHVDNLIRKDREAYEAEYERWLNEPVKMTYTIRAMPTIYLSYDLPSEITNEEEAVVFVSTIAKNRKCLAWLSLSRRVIVFMDSSGGVMGRDEKFLNDKASIKLKRGMAISVIDIL